MELELGAALDMSHGNVGVGWLWDWSCPWNAQLEYFLLVLR